MPGRMHQGYQWLEALILKGNNVSSVDDLARRIEKVKSIICDAEHELSCHAKDSITYKAAMSQLNISKNYLKELTDKRDKNC